MGCGCWRLRFSCAAAAPTPPGPDATTTASDPRPPGYRRSSTSADTITLIASHNTAIAATPKQVLRRDSPGPSNTSIVPPTSDSYGSLRWRKRADPERPTAVPLRHTHTTHGVIRSCQGGGSLCPVVL